jgi:hypothetical protein
VLLVAASMMPAPIDSQPVPPVVLLIEVDTIAILEGSAADGTAVNGCLDRVIEDALVATLHGAFLPDHCDAFIRRPGSALR